MREAEEVKTWRKHRQSWERTASDQTEPVPSVSLPELNFTCTSGHAIFGGLNGSGKTRALSHLHSALGGTFCRLIVLPELCQVVLSALRSRDDLLEMSQEYDPYVLSPERIEDIQRVIGRAYDSIEWFSLELDLPNPAGWSSLELQQPELLPYFRVRYRGVEYDTLSMGLGEMAMHLLFWVLEQYRDAKPLILLLDEPDAYLPPAASLVLIHRILNLCASRGWQLIVSTHSQSVLEKAESENALWVLQENSEGRHQALKASEHPGVVSTLLASACPRRLLFVEDESAFYLAKAILKLAPACVRRESRITWGNGFGYMHKIRSVWPKKDNFGICLGFWFDGDRRNDLSLKSEGAGVLGFLPTTYDPDTLFMQEGSDPRGLATKTSHTEEEIIAAIKCVEGADAHDWVNEVANTLGRQVTLQALAESWVAKNEQAAQASLKEIIPF